MKSLSLYRTSATQNSESLIIKYSCAEIVMSKEKKSGEVSFLLGDTNGEEVEEGTSPEDDPQSGPLEDHHEERHDSVPSMISASSSREDSGQEPKLK